MQALKLRARPRPPRRGKASSLTPVNIHLRHRLSTTTPTQINMAHSQVTLTDWQERMHLGKTPIAGRLAIFRRRTSPIGPRTLLSCLYYFLAVDRRPLHEVRFAAR